MSNYTTNLKTWGSTGQEYPNNYSYVEGEQPVDAWDNFFNYNTVKDIEHLIGITNARLADEIGNEAQSGGLRLNNLEWIVSRNNAGDGDVQMLYTNSNDEVEAGTTVRLGNDLVATDGEVIWDESNGYIPESSLEPTTKYTDEKAQDAVGTIMSGSSGIISDYDDANDSITISIADGGVDTIQLASDSVTGTEIAADAVDTTQLVTSAVTSAINNDSDHGSTASHNYSNSAADISDVSADADLTSADWGDYEIQKDGTDGSGIINFKTA